MEIEALVYFLISQEKKTKKVLLGSKNKTLEVIEKIFLKNFKC